MRLAYCCSKDLATVLRQRVNKVKGMKRVQQDTTPSHAGSGQRILFTGPDGIGDFRPKLDYFPRSIGIGPLSPDATSDLNYLFRPAAYATPPLPKHRCTGEVGWGLQYCTALNRRTTVINHKLYQVCSKDSQRIRRKHNQTHYFFSRN